MPTEFFTDVKKPVKEWGGLRPDFTPLVQKKIEHVVHRSTDKAAMDRRVNKAWPQANKKVV